MSVTVASGDFSSFLLFFFAFGGGVYGRFVFVVAA
jgi:hypothetical protein